jgi:hypothetical protein
MPGIPADITIAGRTPATIKGRVAPLINTASAARGGYRAGDDLDGGNSGPLPEGAYDMSKMSYLGAFKVDYDGPGTDETDNYNEGRIGLRPSDGTTNGSFGSFYIDMHVYFNGIAEFDIPQTLGQGYDINSLPNAVNLQAGVRLGDKQANSNGNDRIGFIGYSSGKLYVSAYNVYDTNANLDNVLVFDDPTDLAGSTTQGWLTVAPGDKATTWWSEIPSESQSLFGGDTHIMGNAGGMSIVSRNSAGPSMYTFTPANIQPSDTAISVTEEMFFPLSNSLAAGDFPRAVGATKNSAENWDQENEASTLWILDQLGSTFAEWADEGFTPELASFGLPPTNIRNDLFMTSGRIASQANLGFIVPGTTTYLCLGHMLGHTYGEAYFNGNTHIKGPAGARFVGTTGGYKPYIDHDQDSWFWAFDVNEILAASNNYDPRPYDRGVFDNSRWLKKGNNVEGFLKSAQYDAVNDRLYVLYTDYEGEFRSVVAVYSLGIS